MIGGTLYKGNGTNAATGAIGVGTFPIILLDPMDPLFVDAANDNYYLAPFSQAIDSSLNSLGDRSDITRVKAPLGLGLSPILAPGLDVYGQLRGDDEAVATPAGQGANVFIDRGAIDRVDFFQPTAVLALPEDQSTLDLDSELNAVWTDEATNLRQFRIRLIDEGIGIDDATISSSQFVLERDGVVLVEGTDYIFTYNSITNEAIFSAVTFFPFESRYTIIVDNNDATSGAADGIDGVRDLAGNYLAATEADGSTKFRIVVTDGENDAPINGVPAAQTTDEDVPLVFSTANGNAITVSDSDVRLGDNRLTVTLTAVNGTLTLPTLAGLTLTNGTGTGDLVVEFEGDVDDLNAALDGLVFTPDQDYFGPASLTVLTSDNGQFAAPGSPVMTDSDTIDITVNSVNDAPTFDNLPVLGALTEFEDESSSTVTVPSFVTGQNAGPANEDQTLTAQVTVISTTGAWTPTTFFTAAGSPQIDPVTGTLTFQLAQDVNGSALVRVVLVDSELAQSVPQTFTITVNPVNDEPVFTLTPEAVNINSLEDEDADLNNVTDIQSVDLIDTFAAGRSTAIDEIGVQNLTWVLGTPVPVSGNLTFDLLQIQADGTLLYQPSADTAGEVTVTLTLMDDGSNVFPNDNLSSSVTLTIVVTQVNDAPVAVTPDYVVDEGYSLTLDATGSFDVDEFFGDTLSYSWDIDGDGTYDLNTTAETTVISWATLQSVYGITAPAVYDIKLQVTDSFGPLADEATATFTTLIVDYGDAPDSYGTTQGVGGAAHTIQGNLHLGATVDNEVTGVPTPGATGDDAAGTDDEDGVVFPTSFESTAGVDLPTYFLVTSSESGKLDIWLDLDQDGAFSNAEHINAGVSYDVVAGVNRIDFEIPAGTPTGDTAMRFRVSSTGGLAPTGRADDGEVEDYVVTIQDLQAPVAPSVVKPVDVIPGDAIAPETSDSTPIIEWSFHDANYFYDVLVEGASGPVFSQTDLITTSTEVTTPLLPGTYTVTVTAKNRAGTPAVPVSYTFDVVAISVQSPSDNGVVNDTYRPTITWTPVAGSKSYTVQIVTGPSNTVVHTGFVSDSGFPPNAAASYDVPIDLPIGTYKVRIRATDGADLAGDWSPYSTFKVRTPTTITAPIGTTNLVRPTITWDPIPGAVTYTIQVNNFTDAKGKLFFETGLTSTSFTPTFDLALATYNVWVIGYNADGESSIWSSTHSFTVSSQVTAIVPTGRLNDPTPTFGWEPVVGADAYNLIVRNSSGTVVINVNGLPSTSYTSVDELPLGQYTYQIQAVNLPKTSSTGPAVLSAFSQNYSFMVATAPTVLTPESTVFGEHPEITWEKPLGAGNSEIYIRQTGGEEQFLIITDVPGTSYIPTERVFGIGTYTVWVRTFVEGASSSLPLSQRASFWSPGKTFRVATPPTNLLPTGRVATSTPTLTWEGVPGAVSYEVWVNNETAPVRAVLATNLNSLSYTPSSDLPIGRYIFWTRARNAFGTYSNWSTPVRFEIATAPTLSGPPASTFDRTPDFSWNSQKETLGGVVTGAQSYEFILYRVNPATARLEPFSSATGLSTPNYTPTTDLPDGKYRAWVRSVNPGRPGSGVAATYTNWSSPFDFAVGGVPVLNSVPNTTDTTPTITWQTVGAASGYEIYISLPSTPGTPIVRVDNIGLNSFTVQNPLATGTYRVWVRAISSINGKYSGWSSPITMNIVDAADAQGLEIATDATLLTAVYQLSADSGDAVARESAYDASVSMLPARTPGTQMPQEASDVLDTVSAIAVTTESPITAEVLIEETDEVLAGWGDHSWWESAEKTVEVQPASDEQANLSLLGALLAFSPLRSRRRKNEEK
ncbi:MAG: hypothetical protein KDA91_20395 [Planctomycetaceae bacterium]|nr:hypothetical protein [Planctomycetaceae bacterium]